MQKFNLTTVNNNGAEVLHLELTQYEIMITLTNNIKRGILENVNQIKSVKCSLTDKDHSLTFLKLLKIALIKGTFKDELINKINYIEGSL